MSIQQQRISPDQLFADAQKELDEARHAWETEQRRRARGGCLGMFINSIPWWVLIIAIGFFLLSASHTAGVFNIITPGWGIIAPIPIEVGLLYVAFRRKMAERERVQVPTSLVSLNRLLFTTAILVNAAGGLFEAVKSVNVQNLPFNELLGTYMTLPLTAQAALIVAVLAAFIVPIGASVAGEGLAALVFDWQNRGETLDQRWEMVRASVEREALYKFFTANGITPGRAGQLADSYVKYNASNKGSENKLLPASDRSDSSDFGRTAGEGSTRPRVKGAFNKVINLLASHPEWVETITVDELHEIVLKDIGQISRSTVGEALKAYREQMRQPDGSFST